MNTEEIDSLQEILTIYKKRLHILELKVAQYGIDCPPHILIEVDNINEGIKKFEQNIRRKNTQYCEGENKLKQLRYNIDDIEHNLNKIEIREERTYRLFGISIWTVSIIVS